MDEYGDKIEIVTEKELKDEMKEIHIAWPVLSKVELEDSINKMNLVLDRIRYRGTDDTLVLAMKSAISEGEKALKELDRAFG